MEKNNIKIKKTRKIKCIGECVKAGNYFIHPITLLQIKDNQNKICPVKPYSQDNKLRYHDKCSSKDEAKISDIVKFMSIPYLNLNSYELINIYKINNVDDLIKFITKSIDINKPFRHMNRILNAWIKQNYNDLKHNNNILKDIYFKLYQKYWRKDLKIKDSKIIEEISKFVKYWINKKSPEDFYFNLAENLKKFLYKKYG